MTDQNDQATPPEQEPKIPATGGSPKPYDWEAAYKSAQKLVATRDTELNALKLKLTETEQTAAEAKALRESMSALKGEHEEASKKLAFYQKQLERKELILREFPDLIEFEAKGVLPDADSSDDLKGKLAAFTELVQKRSSKTVEKTLKGASPPSAPNVSEPGDVEETEDYLWQKMTEAAKTGNSIKFQEWQAKYDLLQDKKGK